MGQKVVAVTKLLF